MESAAASNTDFHGFGNQIRGELAARIPSGKKLKVLDVGTGFGLNVAFLAQHLSGSSRIWTVDPSEEVLKNVKSELRAETAARVGFVKASADELDFEDGFFDFAVSVMVMHHIEKIRPVLRELVRVVKKGGRLLVVDYKPKAAHVLEFQTRHEESDFFEPATIEKQLEKQGTSDKTKDSGVWYLVEATKLKKAANLRSAPRKPSKKQTR